MKIQLISIAAAVAFASGVAQAHRSPRLVKNADEDRIEAEYKAAKEKCDTLQGNAKDICQKEAKGKEKIAKAELEAKAHPTAANQRKVQEAKADVAYDIAKERCEDKKGNDKDVCEKEAKATHERAKADIKRADAKNTTPNAGTGSTSKTTGK
jgi:membrane protein involved in colicin uptake